MDFDQPVARAGTASFKWDHHPAGVIPLWVADMDFVSLPAVVDAVRARAEHGVYGYSALPESLVESIIEYTDRRRAWRIGADWLVWLPSLVTGIDLACGAAVEPGGAVMTITPVYPPFLMAPATQGCRLLTVPASLQDGRWQLPLQAMERNVTRDTRSLLFCHPHYPLGRVWEADEAAAIVDFCRRHRLVVCSHETHCDLLLDPLGHTPAALAAGDALDFTITLMSPSKTFNLPGLNFAFAIIAAPELRRRFTAAARGLLPHPGCFAIAAAEAAYREGDRWLTELIEYRRGNRDLVERFVAESLPGVSMTHAEATYLAWLDVRRLDLSDPMAACLDAGVALSPVAAVGDPGFLRLNFGCQRSNLQEGLRRLQKALSRA